MSANPDKQRALREGGQKNAPNQKANRHKPKTEKSDSVSSDEVKIQTIEMANTSERFTKLQIRIFKWASIGYFLIFVAWNWEHIYLRNKDTDIIDRRENVRTLSGKGLERDVQEFKAIQNNYLYSKDSTKELLDVTFDAYLNYCLSVSWIVTHIAENIKYKEDSSMCGVDTCYAVAHRFDIESDLKNIQVSIKNLIVLKTMSVIFHDFDSKQLPKIYQCFTQDGIDEQNDEKKIFWFFIAAYILGSVCLGRSYYLNNKDKVKQLFQKNEEPKEKVT